MRIFKGNLDLYRETFANIYHFEVRLESFPFKTSLCLLFNGAIHMAMAEYTRVRK